MKLQERINLLYCFDENYNKQAFVSIMSFIKQNDCAISIFIIHRDPNSFEKFKKILLKNESIQITLFKFNNNENIELPNKETDHVSQATYYRIFLDRYLPAHLDRILYVDADVICIKNLQKGYLEIFKNLKDSGFCFGANTISTNIPGAMNRYKDLNIDMYYFNAGVLFIDYQRWISLNYTNELIKKLNELKDDLVYWDQDVLNSFVNGKYLQINENFNFPIGRNMSKKQLDTIESSSFLLHYSGSKKPWTIEGSITRGAQYYQNLYLEFFNTYHIESNYKKGDLVSLFRILFLKDFYKIKKPKKLLIEAFKNIF